MTAQYTDRSTNESNKASREGCEVTIPFWINSKMREFHMKVIPEDSYNAENQLHFSLTLDSKLKFRIYGIITFTDEYRHHIDNFDVMIITAIDLQPLIQEKLSQIFTGSMSAAKLDGNISFTVKQI